MSDPIKVWGAPEGWDAFLLAQRRREHTGGILHVTRDDSRMARLAEALAFVMPEAEILRFPAWDCLPYDRVSPNPAIVSERIATLARLLEKPTGPRIVLTTVNALVQRVPPRSAFAGSSMDLSVNSVVQPEKLAAYLEANGYGRAGTVMEPGEFAIRGGLVEGRGDARHVEGLAGRRGRGRAGVDVKSVELRRRRLGKHRHTAGEQDTAA